MDRQIKQKLVALGVKGGEQLGVAVSGGVDSMALFHCLCNLRDELNIIIVAYHMEHGIRGQSSMDDMLFVRRECEKRGVACVVERADVPALAKAQGLSLELAARRARYAFLDAQTAAHIATAHHMDDLAETVVMNLLRGSGTRGLTGIPEARGRYIRPMLGIPRGRIERYAQDRGVAHVRDDTNDALCHTRNFVRAQIMPRLLEVNGQAAKHIARTAALLAQDDAALCIAARQAGGIEAAGGGVEIDIGTLLAQMPAVQKRMVRQAIEARFGLCGVEHTHVSAALGLAQKGRSGKRIELGGGVVAAVVYGKLRFFAQQDKPAESVPFTGAGRYNVGSLTVCCEAYEGSPVFAGGVAYFDADALSGACFRHRIQGDAIRPLGMDGRKRLSDYLSDRKVPLSERDALVLLAKGGEVLWVVGVGESETSKAGQSGRLYKITFGENTHAQ